jgi:putative two-component system response regulator
MNTPPTILVVDEEPLFIDVLTRFLHREGYDVRAASNGLEALELVNHALPDLITLGATMPEMDGFTACHLLKKDARTARIPILMITGLDEREYRARGLAAGADDYTTKPLNQSILRAQIRALLHIP